MIRTGLAVILILALAGGPLATIAIADPPSEIDATISNVTVSPSQP